MSNANQQNRMVSHCESCRFYTVRGGYGYCGHWLLGGNALVSAKDPVVLGGTGQWAYVSGMQGCGACNRKQQANTRI